ncbi:class I SAM-dependent methyltransferase [Patulibacter minatonensis]|uniref:class I SAM-dependent methyltransferase n=1 Tax=Patulibacter minatonensis TaxID=298163 RepID=UPI000479A03D|nr:class I SAM-dependent methyltransferase [Patulibacter minatonensis]
MSLETVRNAVLYWTGYALQTRTSMQQHGYTTPRTILSSDIGPSVEYAHSVVERYERLGIGPEGKRVLELGPGLDLGTGAVMLHHGAASYLAIDAFDNRADAPDALYAAFDARYGREIPREDLRFRLCTFPELPEVDEQFDVIVSHATLEHIPEIPHLFRSLKRVAAPGCVFVHQVDGISHAGGLRPRDPLNMLRYSDATYDRIARFPGRPNRLRAGDFADAARAAGFHDVSIDVEYRTSDEYLRRVRPALDPQFRDRDDLDALTFNVLARG